MRATIEAFIVVVTFTILAAVCSPLSSSMSVDDLQFTVYLCNGDNEQINTITDEDTIITFDTETDATGTKYYMSSATVIKIAPASLYIESDSGTYNSFVTITGLKSYLAESGIRMTITNGDQHYSADLTKDNQFTSYFNNSDAYAVLDCNKPYSISMTTLGAIETTVPPEDITDISFTFTVHMAKGNHQVMFISQDEVVDAYKVMDGYKIDKLPSVSRTGYELKGWFLPDGREVTEEFVVTEDDADIIATAEWEKKDGLPIAIIIVISITAVSAIAGTTFFVIRKRRGDPAE